MAHLSVCCSTDIVAYCLPAETQVWSLQGKDAFTSIALQLALRNTGRGDGWIRSPVRTGSVCSITAGWPACSGRSRNRFYHGMAEGTDLAAFNQNVTKAHTVMSPPRCAVSAPKLSAFLPGPVLPEVTLSPPSFPQRSPPEFSPTRGDALRTCSLEAASRQPGSLGHQPREEPAWPSLRSLDSPDQAGECLKQHLVGRWVSSVVRRLLAAT